MMDISVMVRKETNDLYCFNFYFKKREKFSTYIACYTKEILMWAYNIQNDTFYISLFVRS